MDGVPCTVSDAFGCLGLLPAWPCVPVSCPGPHELLFQVEQHIFGEGLSMHAFSVGLHYLKQSWRHLAYKKEQVTCQVTH